MRNLLAFLAAAVLTFAVVGWYLNWYNVERVSTKPGHQSVHIDINTEQIGEDIRKGEEKIHEAIDRHSKSGTETAPENGKGEAGKASTKGIKPGP
jgi:hypothetical protein